MVLAAKFGFSHTSIGDTSRSPAGYPELLLALYDLDHCVFRCPQGPTGEARFTVAVLFHRLPTRSDCLSFIEPPKADFDHASGRLVILYHRSTERLDHGLGKEWDTSSLCLFYPLPSCPCTSSFGLPSYRPQQLPKIQTG